MFHVMDPILRANQCVCRSLAYTIDRLYYVVGWGWGGLCDTRLCFVPYTLKQQHNIVAWLLTDWLTLRLGELDGKFMTTPLSGTLGCTLCGTRFRGHINTGFMVSTRA